MISVEELKAICPTSTLMRLTQFVDPLNETMDMFGIDTPARQAAFLAQVAHESGGFHYVKELASGEAYEGRADLGNTEPGDGVRYKGRGLIQITGKTNYTECGDALGLDLLAEPELLEQTDNATKSAGWFWNRRLLNALADAGEFQRITRRINGGLNGYQDRLAYWERAKAVIG